MALNIDIIQNTCAEWSSLMLITTFCCEGSQVFASAVYFYFLKYVTYLSEKMNINWNSLVISLDFNQSRTECGEGSWRIVQPCFSTSVTIHEDTLLWRIWCIFLRHGFLSIKEMILLPFLFCEFWNRNWHVLCSFLKHIQSVSYWKLKDFIVRKRKYTAWILWTTCNGIWGKNALLLSWVRG